MVKMKMKVWFDILTPKQLIFLDKFSKFLKKLDVETLLTSRNYGEVVPLARLHKIDVLYYGDYGYTNEEKLRNSIKRMESLTGLVSQFKPDVAINCCSPDACRVAYGLGIPLFLLNDTPWADVTNKLTMPLAKRVWVPFVYNKSVFTKYGLEETQIKHYNCIDGFITANRKSVGEPPIKDKYVLFRTTEQYATYFKNEFDILTMLKTIKESVDYKILVLCRYQTQYNSMKELNDPQIVPTMMKYDGKMLYTNAEMFIGAGGTMSVESALSGVPTIIYKVKSDNKIADYLAKKNVLTIIKNEKQLKEKIKNAIEHKKAHSLRVRDVVKELDSPFSMFYDDMKQTLGLE